MFLLMILITILIDYLLHAVDLVIIGRYLGPIGTAVILASFVYSLRKRQLIRSGSPKQLLMIHERMAWVGSVMILVHAGIHFNARLPWIATALLLISVASGLVGKYLLKKASETVGERRRSIVASGMNVEEAEKELFLDLVAVDAMKKWRVVHMPIAFLVAVFSLMHIVSILLFAK
ncbi:MAG: hypothetical protein IPL52_09010 [Flavobacteriales bacterium]|nr:hypothetical protein [Flavobacteriales bacterium]